MDIVANLSLGFSTALSLTNLFYCFIGVILGTLVGILPGLGPVATIAMLLPITYGFEPVTALIMLAGIFYGAQYGGSTTAILVNLPGEASSVITALDGYKMARNGKAGKALAVAAIGSFIAGTVATFLIALFAPPLAEVALKFGPAEYFSLLVMGLIVSIVLARGSLLHAVSMIFLGLFLGVIGTDVNSGSERFTFDMPWLADGIGFVVLAMGMYGLGEIINNLEKNEKREVTITSLSNMMLTWQEFKDVIPSITRGTVVGAFLGLLPGGGAVLSSFAAYAVEKKLAKSDVPFGEGAIQGVAGPESANNAGAQTSFIPMLTLGIPSNPTMAIMIGAMMIHSIQPGPSVLTEQPALFWGLIASMWLGNLFLIILNLPMIGLWVRLITAPYHLMFPVILVFCAIGVISINNTEWDVFMMAFFGLAGYVFAKLDCEPAPMLLGFILGPMMEEYLRRALLMSSGDFSVFVTRPISATMLVLSVIALIVVLLPSISKKREETFQE